MCCLAIGTAWAQSVAIVSREVTPHREYAARKLTDALSEQGFDVTTPETIQYEISLTVLPDRLDPEAFSIIPEGNASASPAVTTAD